MELEKAFPVAQRWSQESWQAELDGGNRHVLVWRDDAGLVQGVATFAVADDVVDLHRIVTSAALRRRGLARQLLASGLDWASHLDASRMLLEVEADNVAALALYRSEGFKKIAERRDYYGPGADAVILEKELLP